MADILLDTQGVPATPASGTANLFFDSTTKVLTFKNDTAKLASLGLSNASVATQAYTTAEIFLTGSSLAMPSYSPVVGGIARWHVVATKTAGTGSLVFIIYYGTNGGSGDTARVTFTQASAPTSNTDTATWDITAIWRAVGSGTAALLQGTLAMTHVVLAGASGGFSQVNANDMMVLSSGFDSTPAGSKLSLSFNASTAGAGNIELVTAEYING